MKNNLLYPECARCKSLEDCPHPDVAADGFGSPMPPDGCAQPIFIMKETVKKHKIEKKANEWLS
jgi:hypothetical protein